MLDEGENIIFENEVIHSITKNLYKQPWGGIPTIHSFGDSDQLPPVLMKPMYDKTSAKPSSSDEAGKIAISEFMFPLDNKEATCTFVLMEDVVRQSHEGFKEFLFKHAEGEYGK